MLLRTLTLKNIRSYTDARIDFPQGSVLLSGDVGAGKTTILLAIEFALFGLIRGETPGESLLRHGAKEGIVTLAFELEKDLIVISRTLKKEKDTVKQAAGTLTINGEQTALTPIELRSRILTILGYPQDAASKSKSLVFRYTVYTPQEEMKQILFEDQELRLGALRKVFGIEQYRTTRENAAVTVRELRAEERILSARLEDLPHRDQEHKNVLKDQDILSQEHGRKTALLADAKRAAEARTVQLAKTEAAVESLRQGKEHLIRLETEERVLKARSLKTRIELETASKELAALPEKKESPEQKEEDLVEKYAGMEREVESRLAKAREKRAGLYANVKAAEEAMRKLGALQGTCPLCNQDVPHDHRERLAAEQQAILATAKAEIGRLDGFILEAESKLKQVRERRDLALRERLARAKELQEETVRAAKRAVLESKKAKAQEDLKLIDEETQKNALELLQARKTVLPWEEATQAFTAAKTASEEAKKQVHREEVFLASLEARREAINKERARLERELAILLESKERRGALHARVQWLQETFVPLVQEIERAVFASVHKEFTQLFSSWFTSIIEDDTLQVQVDEGFSPKVQLNGYDTEVSALSGGEKTALALAYRLALNQVINEFIGTIQTRDLLILDEPTDGFSQRQLERLRDIFSALRLKQLILVSHDAAIEGFVDNVLRVQKGADGSNLS